jgi:signal recognition particle subunit SRP19
MVENVLWPAYFDADLSRSDGRRVPSDLAVEDPSVEEIAEAVGQVGYDATVDRDVAYPREHYRKRGRIVVHDATDTGKADLIQAVGAYVTALRD